MSSFLCFICHSTVNSEISDETREKYREVVGMNLCPDSQLCHICCHVLNKLSLFKCICLKRSLEYPVLFSEKGTLNLQRNDLKVLTICSDNSCTEFQRCKNIYQYTHEVEEDRFNDEYHNENEYVALEDNFNDFHPIKIHYEVKTEKDETGEIERNEPDFLYNDKGLCEMDCLDDNETECNDNINDMTNFNDDRDKVDDTFNYVSNKVDDTFNDDLNDRVDDKFNDNINEKVDDTFDVNDKIEDTFNIDINEKTENTFINDNNIEDKKNVKKSKKKHKKKEENIIILSIEEQKAELEARRKEKKYLEAEFKCYNCAMAFLFKDTYQAHMMRHEESNGEYKCAVCTLRFASPAVLRAHAATHARRCGCGARLRRCGCGAPRDPPQRVACHLCGHLLKDANGLQQHLRRVHKSKMSNRLHPCTVCGENFPSQATMRTHMIKHINRKFHCDQCPAVYSSPYTLARHRGSHATTAEHRCGCGARYASRAALAAHAASAAVHRRQGLECPMCAKISPNQRALNLHIQAIHSNTKDHTCPHCPARYSTRPSLLRHIASHTQKPKPKTAMCHLCGSSFKTNSKLNRHLKNVCEKDKLEEQLDSLYG